MKALALAALLLAASEADLRRAQQLAWDKQFAESEALYRRILTEDPRSPAARLGLARVVMWRGRYAEAIALFRELEGVEALEGRATAEYWSGDLRAAARDLRRVLALDPKREDARRMLAEIASLAVPSQRVVIRGAHDDQPLDVLRGEVAAEFFSDPLTRWTVVTGAYDIEETSGAYAALENETRFGALTVGGSIGVFTFPDGLRRPIGGALLRWRELTLRVDRREEIASATALRTHAASTTTALRWSRERGWIGAAEVSHRQYFDGNRGRAAVAYGVVPLRRGDWTLWAGASASARDTDESRFHVTAVSSEREGSVFRYRYRGEYDPYWTPDGLLEARAVFAVERRTPRAGVKLHADGGWARDRGRAFGPDFGGTPLPPATFSFAFDRTYRPWRAGLTADVRIAPQYRIEAGIERGATVDYRSTVFHAALVRRR